MSTANILFENKESVAKYLQSKNDCKCWHERVSDTTLASQDAISGVSGVFRGTVGSFSNAPSMPLMSASPLNIPLGIIGTAGNIKSLKKADNKASKILAGGNIASGILQTGNGILSAYRSCVGSILAEQEAVSVTLFGRVSAGLSILGNVLSAIAYLIIPFMQRVKIRTRHAFKAQLLSFNSPTDQLALLRKKFFTTPKHVQDKLLKKHSSDYDKMQKELIGIALNRTSKNLKLMLTELQLPSLSKKKRKETVLKLLENEYSLHLNAGILSSQDITSIIKQKLSTQGLRIKTQQIEAKKQAKMERITNSRCTKKVKEALALNPNATQVKPLVDRIQKHLKRNLQLDYATLILATIGFAVAIAGLVLLFVSPAGLLVTILSVISLLVSFGLVGIDLYALHRHFKDGGVPGPHDTKLLLASTLFGVSLGGLSIFLTIFREWGLPSLISSVLLAAKFLITNGITYSKLKSAQSKFDREHPTLESLQKNPSSTEIDERIANLPHADRMALQALSYLPTQVALESLLKERERELEQRRAHLKATLAPALASKFSL